MLKRGFLAGCQTGQFKSQYRRLWEILCACEALNDQFLQAELDLLDYRWQTKQYRVLVNQRIHILSRQTGLDINLEQIKKDSYSAQMDKYAKFLRTKYNLEPEEAGKILNEAFARHAAKSNKR